MKSKKDFENYLHYKGILPGRYVIYKDDRRPNYYHVVIIRSNQLYNIDLKTSAWYELTEERVDTAIFEQCSTSNRTEEVETFN